MTIKSLIRSLLGCFDESYKDGDTAYFSATYASGLITTGKSAIIVQLPLSKGIRATSVMLSGKISARHNSVYLIGSPTSSESVANYKVETQINAGGIRLSISKPNSSAWTEATNNDAIVVGVEALTLTFSGGGV